ncbi:hypothetical protein BU23DRAFT_45883 [Bimuria novae-zelandiae CBS 107.79]|uniref:Uncharacterized protein n=1 Tax=Bimuria novae-zelandiae CBS 107.79 TaxID=1447943 RepID=A0A6A5VGP7_9PLEO|nr:hypothetical protein BU23DRAFT_45883 [Bimuria novae-zelandiae CBS 107.79]
MLYEIPAIILSTLSLSSLQTKSFELYFPIVVLDTYSTAKSLFAPPLPCAGVSCGKLMRALLISTTLPSITTRKREGKNAEATERSQSALLV